jgi:glutamate 5-kinase
LDRNTWLLDAKRIVVKIGSTSITGENQNKVDLLVDAIAKTMQRGLEVVLVSSGAIATGMPLFNFETKPTDLATSQALAAVGQSRLISRYQKSLERYNIIAGQVLLTASDLDNDASRANAKRAIERLFTLKVLPIVNENDTVATQEIKFGDNDKLASMVSFLVDAELLVLLSDVDGLYDMPPTKTEAKKISRVTFGEDLSALEIEGTSTGFGTGGAITKVAAANSCTAEGIAVLIASADQVQEALGGESIGTWFEPNPSKIKSRD